jgi:FkbM family methyltransferase
MPAVWAAVKVLAGLNGWEFSHNVASERVRFRLRRRLQIKESRMSTIRQSLLRLCYLHHLDRYRGGYRFKQLMLAGQRSVPVKLGKEYPPVYVDLIDPNWQAMRLFLGQSAGGEDYERHVSETLRNLIRPGDIVYDIGANIGLHSIFIHGLRAKVFAFEPNPKLIPNLRRTFEALRSARLSDVALSDECGTATLFVPKDHDMASLGNWREDAEEWKCPMTTLDALDLPKPDLIKCDVEGAELRVFRGGAKMLSDQERAPIIVFEEQANASGALGFAQDAAQKYLASLPSRYKFFLIDRETCKLEPVQDKRPGIWCDLLAVPGCRQDRLQCYQAGVNSRSGGIQMM